MSYNIILNNTHLINANSVCYQYQYNFIGGGFDIPPNSEISLVTCTIPYSWYNIKSSYGNNTFSYTMPTSGGPVPITITIPDGFYTISDLNTLLSKSLFQNNFYFYNSTTGVSNLSNIIYPIQFVTDAPNYTNAIVFNYIPTSAGNVITQFGSNYLYSNPTIFPSHAQLPTITIPQVNSASISKSTYGLGNILEFLDGTYPSTSTLYYNLATTNTTDSPTVSNSSPLTIFGNTLKTYTYIGTNNLTITGANPTFPPNGSLVNGIVIRCNLIENNISFPSDILCALPITSTFGSNINFIQQIKQNNKMKSGRFSSLVITFNDQSFNVLDMRDPNILINILIKFPKNKSIV